MRRALVLCAVLLIGGLVWACVAQKPAPEDPVKRGEFLVKMGGCNDCHTPWKMGPQGPEPDMSRMLSGHPESIGQVPQLQGDTGPWVFHAMGTMTAWSGPWGVSYTANLTPDEETGTGAWDDAMFIKAMRTGQHLGAGRPILPPMPWQNLSKLSDEDLKAIFAYLRSIPPIKNHVPDATIAPMPGGEPPQK